jgi:hypothetical protein
MSLLFDTVAHTTQVYKYEKNLQCLTTRIHGKKDSPRYLKKPNLYLTQILHYIQYSSTSTTVLVVKHKTKKGIAAIPEKTKSLSYANMIYSTVRIR